MAAFKYFVTLRYKACEVSRYEWAHNPIQAIGIAIANYGASLSVPEWDGIDIVSVTIPPDEIEKAEAAMLSRVSEKLDTLTGLCGCGRVHFPLCDPQPSYRNPPAG